MGGMDFDTYIKDVHLNDASAAVQMTIAVIAGLIALWALFKFSKKFYGSNEDERVRHIYPRVRLSCVTLCSCYVIMEIGACLYYSHHLGTGVDWTVAKVGLLIQALAFAVSSCFWGLIFIFRLDIFTGTAYEIGSGSYKLLFSLLFSTIIFSIVSIMKWHIRIAFYTAAIAFCVYILHLFLNRFFDIITLSRKTVYAEASTTENDDEIELDARQKSMVEIVARQSVLTGTQVFFMFILAIVSSIQCFVATSVAMAHSTSLMMDVIVIVNVICIYLSFSFADESYQRCCGGTLDRCCQGCCTKIAKRLILREKSMSGASGFNETEMMGGDKKKKRGGDDYDSLNDEDDDEDERAGLTANDAMAGGGGGRGSVSQSINDMGQVL